MKLDLKIHLGSFSGSGDSAYLEITDQASQMQILGIELTLENLGKLVSSNGLIDAKGVTPNPEYLAKRMGKKLLTERVVISIPSEANDCYGDDREKILLKYIKEVVEKHYPTWELWQTGFGSQQKIQGKHCFIIRKYVDAGG